MELNSPLSSVVGIVSTLDSNFAGNVVAVWNRNSLLTNIYVLLIRNRFQPCGPAQGLNLTPNRCATAAVHFLYGRERGIWRRQS